MMCGKLWGRAWCAVLLALAVSGLVAAEAPSPPAGRDTLVYKDGDRVHGRLVRQEGGTLVFKSDRFGELRVASADAVVIKGDATAAPVAAIKPAAPPAPATVPAAPPRPAPAAVRAAAVAAAERADEERLSLWDRFSPAVLTARVRNVFGPWKGRFSFSTEVVTDLAERANNSYEMLLRRKWTRDEVQVTTRYDYAETNDVVTTDLVKVSGQWRRDFSKIFFGQYRPTGEWNRASRLRGLPNDYILLQQELGFGYQVLVLPSRKLRVGVSQNRFDTWNTAAVQRHASRGVQSFFEEAEISLPWRMSISQRGVWYPVPDQTDGWENRFDLNKKLTETLSASLRHEIRRNNPDGSAIDYTRLKLMVGLDF
jgi:hypothetical protein